MKHRCKQKMMIKWFVKKINLEKGMTIVTYNPSLIQKKYVTMMQYQKKEKSDLNFSKLTASNQLAMYPEHS